MTDSEYIEISPYEASLMREHFGTKYRRLGARVDVNLIELDDPRYGGSYVIAHLSKARSKWTAVDVYKLTKEDGIHSQKVSRPSKALLALIEQAEAASK